MNDDAENVALKDPFNPINLNYSPGVKDDAKYLGFDNLRNNRPPPELEDQMDQNNG